MRTNRPIHEGGLGIDVRKRARNRGHAQGYGRPVDPRSRACGGKNMPDEAVACDHVDPDFDDMRGAELDILEEFRGFGADD